ncbi:unnamed protein product, partial [Ectocarpus sp. 13 AM-2016]
ARRQQPEQEKQAIGREKKSAVVTTNGVVLCPIAGRKAHKRAAPSRVCVRASFREVPTVPCNFICWSIFHQQDPRTLFQFFSYKKFSALTPLTVVPIRLLLLSCSRSPGPRTPTLDARSRARFFGAPGGAGDAATG